MEDGLQHIVQLFLCPGAMRCWEVLQRPQHFGLQCSNTLTTVRIHILSGRQSCSSAIKLNQKTASHAMALPA